jgi:hypothetical protein
MISQREGERNISFERCVVHHKGKNLECSVENISTSGVLVKLNDVSSIRDFKPGDVCTLNLSDDPAISHREIRCSVSRHTSTHVGLQFTF